MLITSHRGNPLYAQYTLDRPVVTLEAYCKWYEMLLLNPDGSVSIVDPDLVRGVASGLWIDHSYHPKALLLVAKELDAYCCELALEAAAGRWVLSGYCETNNHPLGGYYLDDDTGQWRRDYV